ncbi:hypothetical protein MRX96_058446 [Rhipicephalus microplus]
MRLANELSNFRNSDMVANEESRMSVLNAEEKIRQLIDVESRLAEGFVAERKSSVKSKISDAMSEGALRSFAFEETAFGTEVRGLPKNVPKKPRKLLPYMLPDTTPDRKSRAGDDENPECRRKKGADTDDYKTPDDWRSSRPRSRRRGDTPWAPRRRVPLQDEYVRTARSKRGHLTQRVEEEDTSRLRVRKRSSKSRKADDDSDSSRARRRSPKLRTHREPDQDPTPKRRGSRSKATQRQLIKVQEGVPIRISLSGKMLEGKKRRSKSGDNFAETAADTTRKSAISVIEVSSSISLSDSMTEATTVAQKSSSDATITGKRSISFGAPRNRLPKARTPSSGARSDKVSSQVSVLTVSISDSEEADARGPPPPRRGRNSLASRSRPESPPWTPARTPQHVTRSCSRHLAMQKAAQMRGYSRSPSPKPGYTVASARMYSPSPTRVRSPMRVQSPRRTVFQVVDEGYYAEPVVRDRARLLRREDQRFQMTADDPKPQRDGKWHEPKLRVSYAARVPSRGSHSDSSLSCSMSSKTTLDYERGDSSRGYYRTASQLDRYRDPKSNSSTPQLYYEDSPPRTYHDQSPMGGYVEGWRPASAALIHGRDVSLSRISECSSPNAGNQESTGKMLLSVSSSRLARSASLTRESSFNPRMPRRGTPRNARSSSSPRQSHSMSPRKPDTAPTRIKVRAASSLHLGYETSSSRSDSSRRVTPNWLEHNGLFPDGPLSPPPPKPPVPPPMPPPKGFSMEPLGLESTTTSASAIRITMSPPPMPPSPAHVTASNTH